MILYDLVCDQGHQYEAWFKNAAAFDKLQQAGHLVCEVCGSPHVSKAIMAPRLSAKVGAEKRSGQMPVPSHELGPSHESESTSASVPAAPKPSPAPKSASVASLTPEDHKQVREMMRKVHDHIEINFDNVGQNFAEEARAIHEGKAEDRGIYGAASVEEVKELIEDGIDVLPLPGGQKTQN